MATVSNIRMHRKVLKNLRIDSNMPIINDSYNWNKKTIISSGIICYTKSENTYKYLTIMRRTSIGFAVLVGGNYKTIDKRYIMRLLMNMTKHELYLLQHCSFKELWGLAYYHSNYKTNELYSSMNKYNEKYYSEKGQRYSTALQKFEDLKNGIVLQRGSCYSLSSLIKTIQSRGWNGYTCHPLDFPKGRPLQNEILMNTAKREFCEELNISENLLPFRLSPYMYMESYKGLNNYTYINIYFTVKATPELLNAINYNFTKTRLLSNPYGYEINSILWLCKEEFKEYTNEYKERDHRSYIINELENFLKSN